MSERKVTLYVKSVKGLAVDGHRSMYKAEALTVPGHPIAGGSHKMSYHDKLVTMPDYALPKDQKETVELVTEVAVKHGFRVEVVDVTKRRFLSKFRGRYKFKVYPTIVIDGQRLERTVTRKQIKALLSKGRGT